MNRADGAEASTKGSASLDRLDSYPCAGAAARSKGAAGDCLAGADVKVIDAEAQRVTDSVRKLLTHTAKRLWQVRPARLTLAMRVAALCIVSAAPLAACGGNSKHAGSSHPGATQTATSPHSAAIASATTTPSPFFATFLPPATRTSCRSVVYIGDSTSDGEALAEYVPNSKLRAPAQFARVGVKTTHMEVSGARSIHEVFEGIPNAATVARRHVAAGFRGCWVLALGTNDAADVAAGSTFGLRTRIAQMLSIIGDQPVLWINEITLPSASAYYREAGMRRWNQDLVSACNSHPMLRVFDWAAHAKPSWFIPDGIHYTPDGYIIRTRQIAKALLKAFPRDRPPSAGCLVK